MTYPAARKALNQYRDVGIKASVGSAGPHRLISLLLDGAIGRLNTALGHLQRRAIGPKAQDVSVALSIVGGLRGSLDLEAGGEIAANLDNLYDYIQRRLLLANARNDAAALEEVVALLHEIRAGWAAIDPESPARAGDSSATRNVAAAV